MPVFVTLSGNFMLFINCDEVNFSFGAAFKLAPDLEERKIRKESEQ